MVDLGDISPSHPSNGINGKNGSTPKSVLEKLSLNTSVIGKMVLTGNSTLFWS